MRGGMHASRAQAGFYGGVRSMEDQVAIFKCLARDFPVFGEELRGLHVLALCKATAVRVAPQIGPAESRNVLVGTVRRATRSARGGEVALQLEGGVSLVGFAEGGHTLKVGNRAMASIEESGVVVATSG
jgi:molybdopterin-binding protein